METSIILNDVGALVGNIGMGYTLLGFFCGAVIWGSLVYVISR